MKVTDDYIAQMQTVHTEMGLLITMHNLLPKYGISKDKFTPLDKIDFTQFLHLQKILHSQLAYEYGVEFD
jgi:hypothetical protein